MFFVLGVAGLDQLSPCNIMGANNKPGYTWEPKDRAITNKGKIPLDIERSTHQTTINPHRRSSHPTRPSKAFKQSNAAINAWQSNAAVNGSNPSSRKASSIEVTCVQVDNIGQHFSRCRWRWPRGEVSGTWPSVGHVPDTNSDSFYGTSWHHNLTRCSMLA